MDVGTHIDVTGREGEITEWGQWREGFGNQRNTLWEVTE
jgi:hypothetical protein